jgi:transposase-like protein
MNVYVVEVPVVGMNLYLVNAETAEKAIEISKEREPIQTRSRIQWENANVALQKGEEAPKIKIKIETGLRAPYKEKAKADGVDWEHWAEVYYSGISARKIAEEIGSSHRFVLQHVKEFADRFPQKAHRKTKTDSIDWEHWAKVYYSGVSARKIAKEIKVSYTSVLQYVKKFADQFPREKEKGEKS